MIRSRRVRAALVGAVGVGAVAAGVPAAESQAPPLKRYGGGEVVDRPAGRAFNGRAGDANVSLLTRNDGAEVFVVATVLHACGRTTGQAIGSGRTPVRPDGSFTMTDRTTIGSGRRRARVTVSVTGTIAGERASGSIASDTTTRGRRVCRGQTTFQTAASGPPPGAGPAAAPAGAVLRGIVAPANRSLYDIALRTSADGRSIRRVNLSLPYNCRRPGRRRTTGAEIFYERGGPIRANGQFTISNPYRVRYREGTERGRLTIRGRFVAGGVLGTAELTSTTRRGSRVYDRCRSGRQPFSAVP